MRLSYPFRASIQPVPPNTNHDTVYRATAIKMTNGLRQENNKPPAMMSLQDARQTIATFKMGMSRLSVRNHDLFRRNDMLISRCNSRGSFMSPPFVCIFIWFPLCQSGFNVNQEVCQTVFYCLYISSFSVSFSICF